MSHLETGNPAPPVPDASSKVPGSGRIEVASCSAAFIRLPNIAHDDNAEAILKRVQGKWPSEFRDGARWGFLQQQEGPRDPGGYPLGFNHWQVARRNAWFAGFNVGFHDRLRLSKREAA
jgi:hypothetical protein